jgi:diguanylate cyclase (GGDEF)-like protein
MRNQSNGRPLTLQVTLSVLMLSALAGVLVVVLGMIAVVNVDAESDRRQKVFAANGIREQIDNLEREQQSVVVWDDAVTRSAAGDQAWMSENLGEWMWSYYGHDRAYVLDGDDKPIHAMQVGKTESASVFNGEALPLLSLVRRLRAEMAKTGGKPTHVDDIVQIGSVPALVSVQPIVPSSDRVGMPDRPYVHIAAQFIDQDMANRIAEHYLLASAQVSATPCGGRTGVPLANSSGVGIAYLCWTPDRPGLTLLRNAAPALAIAAFVAALLVTFLLRRLRRATTALQQSQDAAQFLAFHDGLTGLPNRSLFEDRLELALATVRRGRSRMALICLDLDRFKAVNDTLGHPAGDELIRQAAARLTESVREVDTVARLGGDEFAIVLVDIRNLRTAQDVCRRLLIDLAEPFDLGEHTVRITASIGIAVAPEQGIEAHDLMRKSDTALYEAKRRGGGRYQVFGGQQEIMGTNPVPAPEPRPLTGDRRATAATGIA